MSFLKRLGASSAVEGDGRELIDFSAVNHAGEPRDRSHLLGHPSVLWFYPMADTPG